MYATFGNQLYHLLHYFIAFALVMILVPQTLFVRKYDNALDQMIANGIKMVFYTIIVGYILVILKLYEVLSLVFLYVILLSLNKSKKREAGPRANNLLIRLFDILDGIIKMNWQSLQSVINRVGKGLSKWFHSLKSVSVLVSLLLFLVIISYSIYIRFYDAIIHAAPPLSDSYVTLAWMKYIDHRQLFHDGIYPQGFHIYLATLFKFSGIDALYILKYTGPFNMILVILGFYYIIYRLTNNRIAAVMASFVYGLTLKWEVNYPIDRQVATNSQEFAFVFVFLSLYFLLRYSHHRKKEDLLIGFFATSVVGLVHSLAFAYLGLAIFLLLCTVLIVDKKPAWIPVIKIIGVSLLSVIIAVLPLIAGLLLGKELHSSSENYLTSTSTTLHAPTLYLQDYIILGLIALIGLSLLVSKLKEDVVSSKVRLFAFLIGLSTFSLYYFGPGVTGSVLVGSRSIDLWFLSMPFIVGIGWHTLFEGFFPLLNKVKGQLIIAVTLCIVFIATIQPAPIRPYKMQWDSSVEQFLKIRQIYRPKTWMIVSQAEGYALVLGVGYHMYLQDFLSTYDPTKPPLTKVDANKPDRNIPPDVFVFQQKNVFEVSKNNSIYSLMAPKYEQRKKDDRMFSQWIKKYKAHHYSYSVFYNGKHLIVYHFKRVQTKKEQEETIWGIQKK